MTPTTVLALNTSQLSLYQDAPSWDSEPTWSVGTLQFSTLADGLALLEEAEAVARSRGATRLLGPMNGDTWHSYRAVLESDGSPPFLMEPTSGPFDLQALQACGFAILETYASAKAVLADSIGTPPKTPAPRLEHWDGQNPEPLFADLYALTLKAFPNNRFYKPITKDAFLDLYKPLLPFLDPSLILLARDETGALIGYLFGMHSVQSDVPTVIVKTYASLRKGVGHHLLYTFQKSALEAGSVDVIHALMHEDNISLVRSGQHHATVFRRYALLGKRL
jgi:hypothetical protein